MGPARRSRPWLQFILMALLLGACQRRGSAQTFTNPLFKSQDPWVLFWHGSYYYSESSGQSVLVRQSKTLTGLASATPTTVWTAPSSGPNSQDVWAPEIHWLNGVWYIYYAADDGNNADHRLFVLKSTTASPFGPYSMAATGYSNGELYEPSDCWAIDPDVFTAADGHLYIVWSGWAAASNTTQNLYIAPLSDPLHIGGSRVLIAQPAESWETRTAPIEEGPVGYVRHGITYITYSASASWTTDYAVGLLTDPSGNILSTTAWVKSGPILDHHSAAYGPGSVVFTLSPDGTESWMLYHGIDSPSCTPSYTCRDIRLQPFTWNADGSPLLGDPVDPGVALFVPSGENGPHGWGAARSGDAVTGAWKYLSAASAQSASDGATWHMVFRGDTLYDYSVSAAVQWAAMATGDGFPKYGLYAFYADANNHAEAFLDRNYGVFATHAVVQGTDMGWQNTSLPAGFDPAQFHTLSISKNDSLFTFRLDGAFMQQRRFALLKGQIGLVTDGTQANYQKVSITDHSNGWEDAFGDAAEGNTSAGLRTGGWTVQGASGADGTTLGSGWNQLFRGNPNLASYTVSADLKWLQTGTTSAYPKYGIYASYNDVNNHVEVFLDRKYGVLATHAFVGGIEASWQNTNLPDGFDPTQYHTLKVTKSGSLFTFLLDGSVAQQRTFAIENGQIGLVTEDTRASYRNVSVTGLP